jgi:hypothetical protein
MGRNTHLAQRKVRVVELCNVGESQSRAIRRVSKGLQICVTVDSALLQLHYHEFSLSINS